MWLLLALAFGEWLNAEKPCSDEDVAVLAWNAGHGGGRVHCALQRNQRLATDPRLVSANASLKPGRAGPQPPGAKQPPGALRRALLHREAPYAVHLSVFLVRESWCAPPCKEPTWEIGTPKPEPGGAYQLLEAAIWLDEGRVALYEFDPIWEDLTSRAYFDLCDETYSCDAYFGHREAKRILQVNWDPAARLDLPAFSATLTEAFEEVFARAASPNPENILFSYSGHGGFANGGLFEGFVSPADSARLFRGLGRKVSLMNFGGNCVEGKFDLLAHMKDFADYIMASDLPVKGIANFGDDEEARKMYLEARAELDDTTRLEVLMMDRMPIRDAAVALLDGWIKIWNTAKAQIVAEKLEQTKAAFDLAEVPNFQTALTAAWDAADSQTRMDVMKASTKAECDVDVYARTLGAPEAFEKLRFKFVSTQDLFDWEVSRGGLGFNYADGFSGPCDFSAVQGGEVILLQNL